MREFKSKFESKQEKPFSWSTEDEIGSFRVTENNSGIVLIEIANKNGEKVVLNDMLPEGYELVGDIKLLKEVERFGVGAAHSDSSWVDVDNKAIVISEKEVKRDGRRYMLVFLHELGHIIRNQENPELKKQYDEAFAYYSRNPEDIKAFKYSEELIAADERDAWAFAIREYKKLIKKLGLPKEKIFKTTNDLKEWLVQISLGLKIDPKAIERFSTLSEENKDQLSQEVSRMYIGGKSL